MIIKPGISAGVGSSVVGTVTRLNAARLRLAQATKELLAASEALDVAVARQQCENTEVARARRDDAWLAHDHELTRYADAADALELAEQPEGVS